VTLTLIRTSENRPARVAVPARRSAADKSLRERPARDIVDEWGVQSFPASDPPANW
jgi:hypothetical protein